MKHKRVKLCATLLLGIGLMGLQAQTMYVMETGGTQTPYTLSSIRKLTFSGGNISVNKTGGNADVYALSGIRYLNFTDLTVGISQTEKQDNITFNLFPNPVNEQLQLSYETPNASNLQIEIIDLQSRILQQQTFISQSGINYTIIPVSQLAKGIYVCRIQSADIIEIIKFIKN